MQTVLNDYDLRWNVYALLECALGKEPLSATKALAKYGLIRTDEELPERVEELMKMGIIKPEGKKKKKITPEIIEQMNKYYNMGYTMEELTKAYDVCIFTIDKYIENPRDRKIKRRNKNDKY